MSRRLPKSFRIKQNEGGKKAQGLAYCDRLFALEKEFAKLTPEERYEQRLKQEKPVLDAFSALAEKRTVAPKSALEIAMSYSKDQWPYLTNYIKLKDTFLSAICIISITDRSH